MVEFLVKTMRSKPMDASLDNPLCEIKMSKVGPFAAFMEKGKAVERLCKLFGWDAPDKVEHTGNVNVTVLTEERQRQLAAKKRDAVLRRMSKTPTGAN